MKPTSNPADREETIFHAALHLTNVDQRRAFLDLACQQDTTLRRRIERLLASADDTFLENRVSLELSSPTPGSAEALGAAQPVDPKPAPTERIGPYKILQKIGEGGCGIVYMAEQEQPIRRRVALKIIKLGMDTEQVIARFEAERQALALMDHPNIAKVFDAGTTDKARPYFVMELVKGIPITRFCDENNLSTEARLNLFLQVCRALQHAHQKAIIHRDIKPSNVLVADYDGVPVPKIIDFGIAKATSDQRLTDRTLFTAFEQFIGTPAYMSPEQARFSGLDVDTRTDIYSLGVLMYELLVGRTPFEPRRLLEAGIDEIRRILQEEEPAPPSTRLQRLDGAEQTTLARHRQADPPKLAHLLRGDLDWIVMKALEKDRTRRYETVNALALDIERHLNHEPVLAGPPSTLYRLHKSIRRHKLWFITGSAMALALLVGLALSTWAWTRERHAHAQARHNLYLADLNLAQQAWDQNNISAIQNILKETSTFPERNFEWAYWQRQTHQAQKLINAHWSGVNSVSFSNDGQKIISAGSSDSKVKIWDASSGRALLSVDLHHGNGPYLSAALSADGSRIAAGTPADGVKVLNATDGRELLSFAAGRGWTYAVAFSPDGQRVASSSQDGTVSVSEVATGRELVTLMKGRVTRCLAFSPDGTRVAGGSDDYLARVWDAASGKQVLTLSGHAAHLGAVAFSPNGKRIVTASWDGTARVWDAMSGRELSTFRGHADRVLAVSFSPDGEHVLSGSADHTARLWNASTARELRVLKGHTASVNCVAFSPDGARMVTGSADQTLRIWDTQTDPNPVTLNVGHSADQSVAISRDGQRIAVGGVGQAKIWDRQTRRELVTLRGHGTTISSIHFSPDGQRVLTAGWDNTCRLWDAITGLELLTLNAGGTNLQVRSASFSPDGQRILSGCGDATAKVWEASTGRELLHFGKNVYSVAYSPDGRKIATGGWDNKITVYDARTGGALSALPEISVRSVLGALARSSTPINAGHSSWVVSVAFFPDSERLASSSLDGPQKCGASRAGRKYSPFRATTMRSFRSLFPRTAKES